MSKPWTPKRETVALRPSRIRREPVRLETVVTAAARPRSKEREMWGALAGVALIAAGCAGLTVGLSQVTSHQAAAAAAAQAAETFPYCRREAASDCIVDGDTIRVAGATVQVAGIDAPELYPAECPEAGRIAVAAAVRLHRLLNGGTVTVTARRGRDLAGQPLRRIEVNGRDVGPMLVAGGLARDYGGGPRSWCQ